MSSARSVADDVAGRVGESELTLAPPYSPLLALLARRELLLVGALVVVSAVVRFSTALTLHAPWIAPDEMVYAISGRSLWENGAATVLGSPAPFYGLYPAIIGVPLALLGDATGLTVAQALQAVAMSLTAVVVWAWCRKLTSGRWALLAATLAVAVPGLSYAGLLMTEALFYPAATVALWSAVRVLTRPTLGAHCLLVGSIAAATAVRLQGVALVPSILLAGALSAAVCRDRRLLLRALPAVGVLAGVGALWVGQLVARGRVGSDALGAYSTTLDEPYALVDAGRWVLWHAGDLFLLVAGLPLLATAALLVTTVRGPRREPVLTATLAVTCSYAVLTVLGVGVFASRFVDRLAERDLLTLGPPLFVLFAVWLSRDAPRPGPWAHVAVFAVAVPAVVLPIEHLVGPGAAHDALMTIPLDRLSEGTSPHTLDLVWSGAVGAAVLVVLFLPRRLLIVLPAVVLALLVGSSAVAVGELAHRSARDRTIFFGGAEPRWIDRAVPAGNVTYLFDGGLYWNTVFHQAFWNHRLDTVVSFAGTDAGPLPSRTVRVARSGVVRDGTGVVHARLVVAPSTILLAGRPLVSIPQQTDRSGLTLWRTAGNVRVTIMTWGLGRGGDLIDRAAVTVYGCAPGRLWVTLTGEQGRRIEIRGNYVPIRTVEIGASGVWRGSVPSPPDANGARPCLFELDTDGGVGTGGIAYERGRRW